ncbi:MAG TPA: hypothetical protein VF096_10885 [Azonexus sp.]
MHPIHDVDALLLLAVALSAKRRPAELPEIMAALDLINGNIPAEAKLAEAISRLAAHDLLCAAAGGLALTPAAERIIAAQPAKATAEEKLFGIKDRLSVHQAKGDCAPVEIAVDDLRAAILTHRAAAASRAKNLLVPKPKPAEPKARPGQRQRKPLPARKRRD